ncbi:misexpression suppressor of ras 4 [Anticarsia gemmatalis]|uniref:misexpression suppressor of ras 4 n=1 Tax=Anticarsia gemmatalis TaxID=129554 RepID=UPI003F771CC7
METNLYSCTRAGRTNSEKTMEDGNIVNTKDDKISPGSLTNLYGERPAKLTANGHEFAGEPSSPPDEPYDQCRVPADTSSDDKFKKRINPLRIHLGKRPFVDNSLQYYNPSKKRKPSLNKGCDSSTPANSVPRVPKLIPKHIDRSQFHNVSSAESDVNSERDKPVPRLVPKSQLLQFKKGKTEKGPQLKKEYAQSLGLQPMVKFKCRKCCCMSFKTLAMLKEHQLVCRAQAKEPALSPEAAPSPNEATNSGPSRVTRKVYLCSACGTYYENWNLFLHMREVHNRHICLFCLGMFSKAEKLSSHLTNKHNVKEFSYDSKEEFFNVYNGTLYLMCCACDEICSEQDDFFNHDCNNVKPKPVPVLISKHAAKTNSMKNTKSFNEVSTNGPTSIVKDSIKPICDRKDMSESKPETVTSSTHRCIAAAPPETTMNEPLISDTSISSDGSATTSKDTINTVDSGMDLESPDAKPISSPIHQSIYSPERSKQMIPNGDDDSLDHSEDSDSPVSDEISEPVKETFNRVEESAAPHVEKEGGIKLKLSLNNANSPVIINSTVDPTVGQQNVHKPPSRVRRPPKRYEKETSLEPAVPPKTPSIKMTICDRADSPFVKTTIFENNKETTLKTLLNNNVDSASKTPENKPENAIKTTIFDNKLEDINTLNRVPKLTVRVPKELLDKDSSSDYSSDSDVSDKLTVDENNTTHEEKDIPVEEPQIDKSLIEPILSPVGLKEEEPPDADENIQVDDESVDVKTEPKTEPLEEEAPAEPINEEPTIPVTELSLDRPLDRYPLKDLLKVFLSSTVHNCIYCNHVRKIAVNCEQLALHMVAQHRFRATVDSITAEELMPETITAKLRTGAPELNSVYINLDSYDSVDKCDEVEYDYKFECFQCYFKTGVHKDLYLHNRKMHQKTILLCVMCKSNFYSYSELICHLCPGTYDSEYEIKFRCCLCNVDAIPSQFRLMVHLRKIHHTCDVCLELCHNQARLSNHVWKHKLHHLCYRCGIAYRNKPDITNHLFWKHGTESVMCKKCLQKKWPHVYHFCTPPAVFICEECSLQFTRAVYLKVHKRFHSGEFPHICTEQDCTEKFVSKKLLNKHLEVHKKKLLSEELEVEKQNSAPPEAPKEPIPVIDLVNNAPQEEAGPSEVKTESETAQLTKKEKKKLKDQNKYLFAFVFPSLNLSESDSSDESDSGLPPSIKDENTEEKPNDSEPIKTESTEITNADAEATPKVEEKTEAVDEKPDDQQVLDIWDNFKKYQAKVEKQKEKTPPLVPIRKHVCESDHDYCLVPTDMNGDDDLFNSDKKKNKKSPKKHRGGGLSSSSSSSSDSDSSCSCGSNCSCSSSSGSSSSSSSDSDSSDDSGNEKKKTKRIKKTLPNRRISTGSNVDVMGMSETPILIPEKTEPPIAETDLETDESETDEEFYDENPQRIANKLNEEKRNQLMAVPSVGPSEGGSISGEASRPATPVKEEEKIEEPKEEPAVVEDTKVKSGSSKKKSKKKKKSKNSKKHGPIKINIPKDVIAKSEVEAPPPLVPNKITISLQSNTVQIPEAPKPPPNLTEISTPATSIENKRASKRRRVPNKFYGYSSDEEAPQTPVAALKPQQPPKLEWRKEDLPSPVTHKAKKEVPSTAISSRLYNYTDPIRLTAPIPDPEPPRILMNSESMESSDSDSSDEGNLEIYQPNSQSSVPPPPTYLNSGTSSLPYAFQRPAVREAREGESVYCYCRCPYDEVSEMIACDAEGCPIEWFHFECVGIMVPPKGKWYCPECRKNQSFSGYR